MDWFFFLHPTDNFWPFVGWRKKFSVVQKALYLLTDIFPQKLGTPFQKTFLAPDSPST